MNKDKIQAYNICVMVLNDKLTLKQIHLLQKSNNSTSKTTKRHYKFVGFQVTNYFT